MSRAAEWWKANALALRVIGTFVALIFVFFFLLTWEPILTRFDVGAGMARLAAWMSFGIIRVLGLFLGFTPHRTGTLGTILGAGEYEVDVSPACSGAVPTSIYLAAVLAYPASARAKTIGALMGFAAIHFVNLVRVTALFLIGMYHSSLFHETHVYVAQALVICVAVAIWLYWASRFTDAPAS